MNWTGSPKRGERWRGPGRHSKTETRRVIDRTIGGDVMFQAGRRTAFNPPEIVSYDAWTEWQRMAKQLLVVVDED